MDAAAVDTYIRDTFPGVETTEAYGYTFFFYGSERMLPLATLAHADNEHDRVSDLDRDGAYRLNIGVSRDTYRALLGDEKPRLGPAGILEGDHNFTLRDQILPHPHYAPQSWVCVVSPGERTFEVVRGLLREAYDRAVLRAIRKEGSERAGAWTRVAWRGSWLPTHGACDPGDDDGSSWRGSPSAPSRRHLRRRRRHPRGSVQAGEA